MPREIDRERFYECMLRGIADCRCNPVSLWDLAGLTDNNDDPPPTLPTHVWCDAFGQFPCAHHLGLEVALKGA
jgi:hypothetical protein